jgi:hypothetical protein
LEPFSSMVGLSPTAPVASLGDQEFDNTPARFDEGVIVPQSEPFREVSVLTLVGVRDMLRCWRALRP